MAVGKLRGVAQALGMGLGPATKTRSTAAAQRWRFWLVVALSALLLFGYVI